MALNNSTRIVNMNLASFYFHDKGAEGGTGDERAFNKRSGFEDYGV